MRGFSVLFRDYFCTFPGRLKSKEPPSDPGQVSSRLCRSIRLLLLLAGMRLQWPWGTSQHCALKERMAWEVWDTENSMDGGSGIHGWKIWRV